MKKKIILVLFLVMPILINAKNTNSTSNCDYSIFIEYQKAAMNIEYETSYSVKDKTFSIKFYNIMKGIYLNHDNTIYSTSESEENEVVVNGLSEGQTIKFAVNSSADNTNCNSSLRILQVTLPFYNTFYGTAKCGEYKNKLTICSSKFLDYKPTEELLDSMIDNYNNTIPTVTPDDPEVNRTFLDDILDFTVQWGIQILLIVVSSVVTILLFNGKLRKIKHGI
mgnify:CR=1 FL=1